MGAILSGAPPATSHAGPDPDPGFQGWWRNQQRHLFWEPHTTLAPGPLP